MAKAILILAIAVVVAGAAAAGWNHLTDPDTLRDTAARMEERAAELRGERTAENAGAQKATVLYDAFLTDAGRDDVRRTLCEATERVGLYTCYGWDAEGNFRHSTGIETDDYQPVPAAQTLTGQEYLCSIGLGEDWAGQEYNGKSLRDSDTSGNADYEAEC